MAKVKIFFDVHTSKTISPLLTWENEFKGMKMRIKDTVFVRVNRYIIEIFWKSSMMVSGLNTRT